jgi:hypothetical protein
VIKYAYFYTFKVRKVDVKEDEIGMECSINGEKRDANKLLVGKPKGKKPIGRPRHKWVDKETD